MSKVLILLNDIPFRPNRICTGVALRGRTIGEGLKTKGHSICYALPKDAYNTCPDDIKAEEEIYWYSRSFVPDVKPDVIVKLWHGNSDTLSAIDKDIPIVLDLPALYLLEVQKQSVPMEIEVMNKISSLALGDYFICANERQWYYYIPWLLLAGVDTTMDNMGIIPVSAPPLPVGKITPPPEPVFVWAGMFWPWQDPIPFLNVIVEELELSSRGSLKIVGGKFPYRYYANRKHLDISGRLKKSERISFISFLAYQDMIELFSSSSVGVDISTDSPERRLSAAFKTVDYLYSGLPIITSTYMDTAHLIEKYKAGWVLNPDYHEQPLKEIVKEILRNPDYVHGKLRQNTQSLVQENLTWDKTIEPLHRFCLNPKKRTPLATVHKNTVSFEVGIRLRELEKYDEAIEEFSNITDGAGKPAEWVHLQNAITYAEKNMLDMAHKELEKEWELYPKADVKLHMGRIFRLQRKFDEALEVFFKIMDEYEAQEWLYFETAMVFMEQEDTKKALLYLEKEKYEFPRAEVDIQKGRALRLEQRFDEAIDVLNKTIEHYGNTESLYFEMALVFLDRGDTKEALNYLEKEDELFPDKGVIKGFVGKIMRLEGYLQKALNYLLLASKDHPKEIIIHEELSILYSLLGNIDNGITYFSKADSFSKADRLSHNGSNYVLYTLASACKRYGRIDDSVKYFNMLINREHVLKEHRGGAYFHLGEIFFNQKLYKEAKECFIQCNLLMPQHKKALSYIKTLSS